IRGFRIELGEIESVISLHPDVRETLVIAHATSPGDKRLIAYIVPKPGRSLSSQTLSAFMKTKLPEYMIPSAFVLLEAFPLTANGKVDRKALPAPVVNATESTSIETRPWLPIQIQLLRIWETLLNIKQISLRDDFFTIGGHSLLAARMVDRIEREC